MKRSISRAAPALLVAILCAWSGTSLAAVTTAHKVYVRKAVDHLTPSEVAAYRKGVAAMKKRKSTDPTSWTYQAAIHWTQDPRNLPLWRQCQHGSDYFLAWHRVYLYYFERILRKASGDKQLALPYWDYVDPAKRTIPLIFRQPKVGGRTNPLYDPRRDPQMNAGTAQLSDEIFQTYTEQTLPLTNFYEFTNENNNQFAVEDFPHNFVHVEVGGDMGAVPTSATDPIFFTHHANIDRIWQGWLDLGGGRANPSDEQWLSHAFTFYDENGKQVTKTGRQILDMAKDLGYRYESEKVTPAAAVALASATAPGSKSAVPAIGPRSGIGGGGGAPSVVMADSVESQTELKNTPTTVKLGVKASVAPNAKSASGAGRIVLKLNDIQFTPGKAVGYKVFVGLPEGEAPDPKSPHFVGGLTSFGLQHGEMKGMSGDHMAGMGTRSYDVTGLVRSMEAKGQWADQNPSVTLVPVGPQPVAGAPAPKEVKKEQTVGHVGRVEIVRE